jgi:hypothetical protein
LGRRNADPLLPQRSTIAGKLEGTMKEILSPEISEKWCHREKGSLSRANTMD